MVHRTFGGQLVLDEFDNAKFSRASLRPQTVYEEEQQLFIIIERKNQAYLHRLENLEIQAQEAKISKILYLWRARLSLRPIQALYKRYLLDFFGGDQE
jgi:hypothetical protein